MNRGTFIAMPTRGRPRIHPANEPAKTPRGRKPTPPVYDSLAETRLLIMAVLRTRGERGATPEALQKVVAWARSVRTETDLLQDLAGRQRRTKNGTEPDRMLVNETNRALLDGVLEGALAIRVADDGGFSFATVDKEGEFRIAPIEELSGVNSEDGTA